MQVWRNCQIFFWKDRWLVCLPKCSHLSCLIICSAVNSIVHISVRINPHIYSPKPISEGLLYSNLWLPNTFTGALRVGSCNTKLSFIVKIWSFHDGHYEECCLLLCDAMQRRVACVYCYLLLTFFLSRRFLTLWWRMLYFPPKRQFVQEPHGVTPPQTAFFFLSFSRDARFRSRAKHWLIWVLVVLFSPSQIYVGMVLSLRPDFFPPNHFLPSDRPVTWRYVFLPRVTSQNHMIQST
jgi:hypothetical protein